MDNLPEYGTSQDSDTLFLIKRYIYICVCVCKKKKEKKASRKLQDLVNDFLNYLFIKKIMNKVL